METDEHPAHKQQDVQTYLLHLPNELLHRVSDCLADVADILRLRLACVRLSNIGLEQLQKRMTRIYVAPSIASLQRFQAVCEKPFFADYITEIIYAASLHALGSKDIYKGLDFQTMSERYGADQGLIDRVLTLYEERKDEQDKLLASDEVGAVMARCIKLLPKLTTVTYCGQVHRIRYKSARGGYPDPIEPPAYNRERNWSAENSETDYQRFKDEPLHAWAEHDLLRAAETGNGAPGRWQDSPNPLIHALAKLMRDGGTRHINFVFKDCQPSAFDDDWASFAADNIEAIQAAMRTVETLTIDIHWSVSSHYGGGFDPIVSQGVDRWVNLVQQAQRLQSLNVVGSCSDWCSDFSALAQVLLSKGYWPKLESCNIDTGKTLNVRDSYDSDDPETGEYKIDTLVTFLLRHRKTLKRLQLAGATGYGTVLELKEGLRKLKNEMTSLESANVINTLDVQEDRDGPAVNLPWDTDWKARDRLAESNSELGRLARELGVVMHELEDPKNADEDRAVTLYPISDRAYSTVWNTLKYEYDFGPYVLVRDKR